jgi:hypothetical protein
VIELAVEQTLAGDPFWSMSRTRYEYTARDYPTTPNVQRFIKRRLARQAAAAPAAQITSVDWANEVSAEDLAKLGVNRDRVLRLVEHMLAFLTDPTVAQERKFVFLDETSETYAQISENLMQADEWHALDEAIKAAGFADQTFMEVSSYNYPIFLPLIEVAEPWYNDIMIREGLKDLRAALLEQALNNFWGAMTEIEMLRGIINPKGMLARSYHFPEKYGNHSELAYTDEEAAEKEAEGWTAFYTPLNTAAGYWAAHVKLLRKWGFLEQ